MSYRYHDGKLLDVEVDWKSAAVTVRILINRAAIDASSFPLGGERRRDPSAVREKVALSGTWSVIIRDFIDVRIPQRQPWGPSVFVMTHSIEELPDGSVQSGDVIEVTGRSVEELNSDAP